MASIPVPPSAEEQTHFFFGLPTQPMLVARTDCMSLPWTRPLYRILGPVTDTDLVQKWRDSVAAPLESNNNLDYLLCNVFAEYSIDWTFYVPLNIHGRRFLNVSWTPATYPDHPSPTDQMATYLVVGIHKNACNWHTAFAAATACRLVLSTMFPSHDIQVLMTEMSILSLDSPPAAFASRPASFPTQEQAEQAEAQGQSQSSSTSTQPTPAPVLEIVAKQRHARNPLFNEYSFIFDEVEPKYEGRYKYDLFPDMRRLAESVVCLLPFPGQVAQPIQLGDEENYDKNERPRGSIGLYIRLLRPDGTPHEGVSEDVFALTSRHVAIGRIYNPNFDFRSPTSKLPIPVSETKVAKDADDMPPIPTIAMAWGSNKIIRDNAGTARLDIDAVSLQPYRRLRDKGELENEKESFHLRMAEHFVGDYGPRILSLLNKEWQDPEDGGYGTGAAGRVFGYVELAGRVDITKAGFVRDWALTKIISDHHVDTNAGGDKNSGAGNGSSSDRESESEPDPSARPAAPLPAPPPRPPLFSNHVFVGLGLRAREYLAGVPVAGIGGDNDGRSKAYHEIFSKIGPAGFFALESVSADCVDPSLHPRFVAKRGFVTGTTMGVTNPILAVTRKPDDHIELPGPRTLPILTIPPNVFKADPAKPVELPATAFSLGGDSGSAIFDSNGRVIAMLDGGIQADQGIDPAILQSAENTMGKDWEIPDVTFATPMAAVFEDIRQMTGLQPSLV